MLNCRDVTRLCSESQDRELSFKESMSLKVHTMMCSGCRNFGQQMDTIRQAMRNFVKADDDHTDGPRK